MRYPLRDRLGSYGTFETIFSFVFFSKRVRTAFFDQGYSLKGFSPMTP